MTKRFSLNPGWLTVSLACFLIPILFLDKAYASRTQVSPSQVGAEQIKSYLPLLENKRVGLIVNQTSRVGNRHLVDFLLDSGVDIKFIFAPEHGFRGEFDAGAHVDSGVDSQSGLPIVSIYGKQKKPSPDLLAQIDVLVFDIQDVGVRFYTYLSSMHYMMQAAAETNTAFIVLDRPNPNIAFVDGPLLESEQRSFVGLHPIPILHGMTLGELAKMIVGEGWLTIKSDSATYKYDLDLTVIPVQGYNRSQAYILPVKPSPNLPTPQSIRLYPSLCLFEGTAVSVGRGTDVPFQVLGHDTVNLGNFQFSPRPIKGAALNPKLKGQALTGWDLRTNDTQGLNLSFLLTWHQAFKTQNQTFFSHAKFFDKLAGTSSLRIAVEQGKQEDEIRADWRAGLQGFKVKRQAYLIYPE